ncbi:MAG: non-homologous end-joining DNA ligase, partial [Actinomycetes bacterium]
MPSATGGSTVRVDGRQLKLTNLDKVLYPETHTTKADVLAYYAEVAEVMLPHLSQRPATRKRWPDGVGVDPPDPRSPSRGVFFNKDLGAGTPEWVRHYPIQHQNHTNDYPVINDLATLTWVAQLAALEIHVPQWRFAADGTPLHPDRLVLDLDPGEGVGLAECAEVARLARGLLRDIGHEPVPVTSGSKGIHLYAPLDGTQSADQATQLARELARALQADHPDLVISVMKRSERAGLVFVDWSQNNGSKTTVSPYSLRGRHRPTVAAPRTWEELDDPDLAQLEYPEVLARLPEHGDPLRAMGAPVRADRLTTYRSMRDPAKTPEPVPPATTPTDAQAGRGFVIQEHRARRLHYDVRLERDGVLVSWAVPKGPPTDGGTNHLAVQTEDHPLEYATFEGTIPRGEYGGGEVSIWDAGTYKLHKWREGREVIGTLYGRPDGGLQEVRTYALIHTGGRGGQDDKNWLMHLMKTDPADRVPPPPTGAPPTDGAERPDGPAAQPPQTEEQLAFPEVVEPMLATLRKAEEFGAEEGWAFEMKWDGVRVVAYLADGQVRLRSRRGRDETAAYPDLIEDLAALEVRTAVLDGEIVVVDSTGRPTFGLLQHRINLTRPADIAAAARAHPARLMLFDVLELNGASLLRRPYDERRRLLLGLVPDRPGSRVQVPPEFDGDLDAAMEVSRALRLEGVVTKRRQSPYEAGR